MFKHVASRVGTRLHDWGETAIYYGMPTLGLVVWAFVLVRDLLVGLTEELITWVTRKSNDG